MNIEPSPSEPAKTAPIFFKLIDSSQEKAEKTVLEVEKLGEKHNISDLLQLHTILEVPDDGFIITYVLNVETGQDKITSGNVMSFLESVFKNLFYKHPAYTEPAGL